VTTVLAECAWSASRTKDTYLATRFWKIASRRSKKKALIATAHKMLTSAYFMLLRKEPYSETTANHSDEQNKQRKTKRLIKQLKELGVNLEAVAASNN
jgi:transposase